MTFLTKKKIIFSNYGRWLGWDVWRRGSHICTLNFHESQDFEWDCYTVRSSNAGVEFKNDEFWDSKEFEFHSRIEDGLIVCGSIIRWDTMEQLVRAKGLYLPKPKLELREKLSFLVSCNC